MKKKTNIYEPSSIIVVAFGCVDIMDLESDREQVVDMC